MSDEKDSKKNFGNVFESKIGASMILGRLLGSRPLAKLSVTNLANKGVFGDMIKEEQLRDEEKAKAIKAQSLPDKNGLTALHERLQKYPDYPVSAIIKEEDFNRLIRNAQTLQYYQTRFAETFERIMQHIVTNPDRCFLSNSVNLRFFGRCFPEQLDRVTERFQQYAEDPTRVAPTWDAFKRFSEKNFKHEEQLRLRILEDSEYRARLIPHVYALHTLCNHFCSTEVMIKFFFGNPIDRARLIPNVNALISFGRIFLEDIGITKWYTKEYIFKILKDIFKDDIDRARIFPDFDALLTLYESPLGNLTAYLVALVNTENERSRLAPDPDEIRGLECDLKKTSGFLSMAVFRPLLQPAVTDAKPTLDPVNSEDDEDRNTCRFD